MHILYIHQHFSTPQGATGTRSYRMARQLIARGHRVTVICGSYALANTGLDSSKGSFEGIDIIEISLPYSNHDHFFKRTWLFLLFAFHTSRLALTFKYDLVVATSTPLTVGIPGILAKVLRRKKFVFEVRDLWPELPRAMKVIQNPIILGLMGCLERLSYYWADVCIGLSTGIVEGIKKKASATKKIYMIPNGSDLSIFKPGYRKDLKLEGVSENDLVAVFCGAHGRANGLNAVLDAAVLLKNRHRLDIKFVFIGDGALKDSLKERASKEGLANCLFMDPMPKVQLAKVLSQADLGLMILANVPAFYYGTSPNKFFDYMASGLPVLVNYPGWLADLIKEHHCGIAVSADNAFEFAEQLIQLADHKDQLKDMGQHSRRLAETQFDMNQLSNQWVDAVEAVYAR